MRAYLKKQAVLIGIATGFFCFLFFLSLYFTGPNPLSHRRPDFGIHVILIFAGIWYYKKRSSGVLHFYEGLSIGFVIHFVGILVSALLLFIFNSFVDPLPIKTFITESINFIQTDNIGKEAKLSDQEISNMVSSFKGLTPFSLVLDEISFKFLFGIIPISLLSMILRKTTK